MALSLSIVTPTLNSANTIRSTLESLRPLVASGAQHIVVDSGSTDGTVEIAEQFGSEVLYHPPGNMYAAINAGMQQAKGDWLTYINGDDLLFADYVTEALEQPPSNVSFIYGDIDFIDEQGRFLFNRRAPSPRFLSWLMLYYSVVPQQGSLFRCELWESLGGFNTRYRYVADRDFFARSLEQGASFLRFSGKSVAAFRLSQGQLSQKAIKKMRTEGLESRKAFYCHERKGPSRVGRVTANVFRWTLNIDGILLRALRGRGQDAAWR